MVEYRWKEYEPVNILNMELAEFDLTKTEYKIQDVEYVAGMWTAGAISFAQKKSSRKHTFLYPFLTLNFKFYLKIHEDPSSFSS